ncbi:hypothetical protein Tco_0627203 [Tanacetum coccineum]|uniref:Uncharacterized protein n=1 Tax=Tanacetum coccineum TaxID=301880 RepID=A0ABQ4WLS5_9ASTR
MYYVKEPSEQPTLSKVWRGVFIPWSGRSNIRMSYVDSVSLVEFRRISLTGLRSCTSRSHYRSVSKQKIRSYLHAAVESIQAVETLQWENILTMGSSSNSGNHSTNSGNPLAFYS